MKENFYKGDFKSGMIAETDDGTLYIVWGKALISMNKGGFLIENLAVDLKRNSVRNRQIKRIYSKPKRDNFSGSASMDYWLGNKCILKYCTIIWERKDFVCLNDLFETKMYTFNSETGEGFRAEFKGSYHTNEEILYAFIVRESGSFGEGYTFAFGAEHSWIITE